MPTSDFTPTVAQVGTLLRARTMDGDGNELGTFTEDTRPTGEQVSTLIQTAVGRIRARFGEDLADDLHEDATGLAALRAAMLVELSYWPEQLSIARSAYSELKALYDEAFEAFVLDWTRIGADDEAGTGDEVVAALPVYAFPANDGGLVDWATVM